MSFYIYLPVHCGLEYRGSYLCMADFSLALNPNEITIGGRSLRGIKRVWPNASNQIQNTDLGHMSRNTIYYTEQHIAYANEANRITCTQYNAYTNPTYAVRQVP